MTEQLDAKVSILEKGARENGDVSCDRDFSRDIERTVVRQPLDNVRCVRVFGRFYRCNWWCRVDSPRGLVRDWTGPMTDRIRKSSFLTATLRGGEIVIEEVADSGATRFKHV